ETVPSIVGEEKIEPAIAIDIGGAHAHAAVRRVTRRASTPGDARAVAAGAEGFSVVAIVLVLVSIHVRDDEIEIAVLIRVEPHGADCFARIGDAFLRGNIRERAAIVLKEGIWLVAESDEEIEVAVSVDIDP